MQVTARRKGLPLDTMEISTDVTQLEPAAVAAQPEDGTYVHGFLMEGARWDRTRGVISDSVPKVLHVLRVNSGFRKQFELRAMALAEREMVRWRSAG